MHRGQWFLPFMLRGGYGGLATSQGANPKRNTAQILAYLLTYSLYLFPLCRSKMGQSIVGNVPFEFCFPFFFVSAPKLLVHSRYIGNKVFFAASYNFFIPTSGEVWLALSDGGESVLWHPTVCSRKGTKDYRRVQNDVTPWPLTCAFIDV